MTAKKTAVQVIPPVDTGTVLYYPNFRMAINELKQWLLFWDRVRCIVPNTSTWAADPLRSQSLRDSTTRVITEFAGRVCGTARSQEGE
jgi:hypothetical protein